MDQVKLLIRKTRISTSDSGDKVDYKTAGDPSLLIKRCNPRTSRKQPTYTFPHDD